MFIKSGTNNANIFMSSLFLDSLLKVRHRSNLANPVTDEHTICLTNEINLLKASYSFVIFIGSFYLQEVARIRPKR